MSSISALSTAALPVSPPAAAPAGPTPVAACAGTPAVHAGSLDGGAVLDVFA